jgi:hypothetical protein
VRRALPVLMRLPMGALGRGPICGDELLLRDWRKRLAGGPVAALAAFLSSTPTNQPGTAHSTRAA